MVRKFPVNVFQKNPEEKRNPQSEPFKPKFQWGGNSTL